MNNPNFFSVKLFPHKLSLNEMLKKEYTNHLTKERLERLHIALDLNQNSEFDKCFVVDKGHPNGPEIHCVTASGIIFIFNERTKFFITTLIARPNQVIRLYKECHLFTPQSIIEKCKYYVEKGLNNK